MVRLSFPFNGKSADCEQYRYVRDPDTGIFEQQFDLTDSMRLPIRLRISDTRREDLRANGAPQIIEGKRGNREFFTGLRSTAFPLLREGRSKDGKAEILFLFAPDFRKMAVYVFPAWRNYPQLRQKFHAEFMVFIQRGRWPF